MVKAEEPGLELLHLLSPERTPPRREQDWPHSCLLLWLGQHQPGRAPPVPVPCCLWVGRVFLVPPSWLSLLSALSARAVTVSSPARHSVHSAAPSVPWS